MILDNETGKPIETLTPSITAKELATIKAALAFWENRYASVVDGMKQYLPHEYHPFFEEHDPLTTQEISMLLLRLNLAEGDV